MAFREAKTFSRRTIMEYVFLCVCEHTLMWGNLCAECLYESITAKFHTELPGEELSCPGEV